MITNEDTFVNQGFQLLKTDRQASGIERKKVMKIVFNQLSHFL